ncbi:Uncharacterised protein [Bordetella pertussis]|nr:Uncharacterised protein [Bordetella pertussis]
MRYVLRDEALFSQTLSQPTRALALDAAPRPAWLLTPLSLPRLKPAS